MDAEKPGYWAVIPARVRYDTSLPPNAKLLYGEISALLNADGFCFAQNAYFASLYGCTEETISRLITKLEKGGYILREVEKGKDGQILRRRIYLDLSVDRAHPLDEIVNTSCEKNQGGIDKIVKDTNTSITKKESKKKEKPKALPLTDDDLRTRIVDWITETLPGEPRVVKNAVYYALLNFYSPRDRDPSRYPAAVTTALNRLLRFSGGDPGAMIAILEEAVQKKWQGIYPGDGRNGAVSKAPAEEVRGEWI